MNRLLIEQNPWWADAAAITSDRSIREYSEAKTRFALPEFAPKNGVYVLRGPRQVGKTTLVKMLIRDLLKTRKPESICYFSAESGYPIEEAMREYADFAGPGKKTVIIDEATGDEKWATKIKYLIDSGKISGEDTLVITGSSSLDLKQGAERLPGRYIEGNEYLFYPYSFRECTGCQAPPASLQGFDMNTARKLHMDESLRQAFFRYIKNGGLPPVWNTERELAKERYLRWAEGLLSKHGKSILYAQELLSKLGEKTVFDFLGLSRETSIGSHHTVESYLSFFEAGMFGKMLYNYSLALNGVDAKKEKKFVFLDPFFTETLSSRRDEPLVVEDIVGSHLLRLCDRLHFYRDKKGEIDFLCELGGELVPVEVKWQNTVTSTDAIHLKKFGGGFIITKDTLDTFGNVLAIPAFVFLAMTGKTMVKRKVL